MAPPTEETATRLGGIHDVTIASTLRKVDGSIRQSWIWLVLLGLVVYCGLAVPNFWSSGNVGDVLAASSALGLVALGQTFVFAVGGLDLSVGSLASLTGVLMLGLVTQDVQLMWAIPLFVLMGVGIGSVTGLTIAWSRSNPVIITFGALSILQGATLLFSEVSIGQAPVALAWIDRTRVGGIVPVSTIVFLVLGLISWLALSHTVFGNHVRAIGSSEPSSLRSGIAITRVKTTVYAISGMSAAVAGIFLAARLRTGYPRAGSGLELSAIVAVILGGTPFGGGRGLMGGTVAGVLLLAVIANTLNLLAVQASVQQIVNGSVVAIAVALYALRRAPRWS